MVGVEGQGRVRGCQVRASRARDGYEGLWVGMSDECEGPEIGMMGFRWVWRS